MSRSAKLATGHTDRTKLQNGNPDGVSHATGAGKEASLAVASPAALDHLVERPLDVTRRLNKEN